ncbi:MAG: hypothetical protein AAFX01_00990 [Cyanobacteria bacterium J06638_28]
MSVMKKDSHNITRLSLALLAVAAFGLPACSTPVAEVDSAEDAQENVTSEELAEDFAAYEGQEVTIRQDIEEVIGTNSFTLDEDQLFGGEELLVIDALSSDDFELIAEEGTEVQVTGEVRRFSLAELGSDISVDLEPELFGDYEGKPVILARSIALSPDPGEVTSNPEEYYNRRIAIEGEVEEIRAEDILTLENETLFGGEALLVLNTEGNIVAQEGEEVLITGVLRPFTLAEIEQEYDLTWDFDLQREIEIEFSDRPVFVADEIYPSAM